MMAITELVWHALGRAKITGPSVAAIEAETPPATAPVRLEPPQTAGPPTVRRPRRAGAHEAALGALEALIDDGFADYPLLAADIDAAGEAWASAHGFVAPPASIVREAFAALPSVKRSRPRLLSGSAEHRALSSRLRALGKAADRATVFTISERGSGQDVLAMNPTAATPRRAREPMADPVAGHTTLRVGVERTERRAAA